MGIPHLVLGGEQDWDLVDYDQDRFLEIKAEFTQFATKLDVHDLTFIPISALNGDNVVDRSANMDWYRGPPCSTTWRRCTSPPTATWSMFGSPSST